MHSARGPIIYCSPVQVHEWLLGRLRGWRPVAQIDKDGRDLTVLSPLIVSGHYKSRWVFGLNCWLVARWLRAALKNESSIDVVVNSPLVLPIVDRLRTEDGPGVGCLAYDVIDDFTAFDWSPSWSKALDRRLVHEADVVFTGTGALADECGDARPDVEFVPLGVDSDQFSSPAPEPEDLKPLLAPGKPLFGYFGTISDRLDLQLLDDLARSYPPGEASVAIIGPIHGSAGALPTGGGNLRFFGPRPHKDLPGYAQRFNVGLIPFKVNEATRKLHPVKLLEYLAAGLPVVSTAIPDVVRYYGDIVAVATDSAEFTRLCQEALERGRDAGLAKERARAASWGKMAERMDALIAQGRHALPPVSQPLTPSISRGPE